ncbi:hypothetical protein CAEBREN_30100 [Caenorhabditis brenneri]|uniref:Ig-like domain-containing protein n=1 Tax=Caenorhabditis brenneri TaxID=135651 RepID=G0PNA2_CAEBE|nr:hypothetical protein CAEBREN_30100 [Caenorhabditis brenneri]
MSNKQVRHEKEQGTLHIIGARDEDQGRYVCEAENIHGVAQSFSVVEIKEAIDKDHVKPKFLEPLVNCSTCEGNEIVLECCVTGKPIPTITWYKDGLKLIIENRMLQYTDRKGVSRLNIMNVVMDDAGEYTCEAVNSLGKDFTHCTVKVVDMGLAKTRLTPVRSRSRSRSRSPSVLGGEIQRPPVVTRPLADATVTEGNRELLEVEVDGFPTPTIEWYHDGKLVAESRTLRTYFDGRVAFLKIYEAHEEHNGQYVCKVSNKLGSVETRACVVVEAPDAAEHVTQMPTFVKKLQDVVLKTAGETATFTCQSYANPAAQVVWLHNGKALQQTKSNYKTRLFDDNTATLVIENVTDELCGTYTAVATNQFGDVHTSAQLTITGSETKKVATSLPYFIIEPKPKINVVEGSTLSIQADLNGSPTPEVVWLKDNSELVENDRIQIKCDGVNYQLVVRDVGLEDEGTYTITAENEKGKVRQNTEVSITKSKDVKDKKEKKSTIAWFKDDERIESAGRYELSSDKKSNHKLVCHAVQSQDTGKYRCVVTNKYGYAESECSVTIEDVTKFIAPSFASTLSDATAMLGHNITLECKVEGFPAPEISWTKDGERISTTRRIRQTQEENGICKLLISKAESDDMGVYVCSATSVSGVDSTSSMVMIAKTTGTDSHLVIAQTLDDKQEKPRFIRAPPSLIEVNESGQFTLIAKAVGEPKPTVTWLKDGREILRTNRIYHHFVTGDGESHLIAECVVSKTSGIFSCKAENSHGTVIAETQVIVQKMKQTSELTNFAPKFTIPLTDMGIVNGHPTTLSCNVTGSPEPTLEWIYIDDSGNKTNLTSSTTSWTECRFGKVAELKSERVMREQRGTYQCIATNSSGQATTQCYLLVGELSDEPAGPPRFVKCLQDTWTPLKESIEFTVELAGFPTPDLTWYHNEKKVIEGKYVKINFPSDTSSVLSIKNVSLANLGMYYVEASNIHGVLRTAGRLNVSDERRKAEPPQFKHVLEPVLAVQPKVAFSEEHPRVSSSAATARVKKGAAPMFLQGLEDMDLKAGASAAVAGKLGRKLRPHRSTTNDADKLAKALAQSLKLEEPRASTDSRPESAANTALDEVRAAINSRNKRPCRPKFMVKPKPKKVLEEYKSLRLKTAISGNPIPQVHWDKEGIILETGNKYSIYNDGDFYYLEVHHVSTFDKGFYNCTAANNEGIVTCTSEIDVLPNKEDSAAQVAKRKSRKEAKAPNFIEVLPGRSQANLNESLCVECSVSAYPCASIIWTRNSVRLLPQADRYTMSYDGECASLKFISVAPGDEGTYSCEAANEHGNAVSSMNLQVSGMDPNAAEGIPPLFRFEKIKSVRKVIDGSRVELAAELVQASEPLQIRWLRNKVTIVDSPSFSYSRSEKMVFLTIADVFPEDGGEYTVEAKNQSGIARCTMQLDVRSNERSVADEAPRVFDFEKTTRSDPGASVELRAKVIGHPDPVISWSKGGQKLNNEERYLMRNEGDTFILRISNVTRADAGKYVLTAINASGQADAELELTVIQSTKLELNHVSKKLSFIFRTVGEKPKFNESPISVQTCEKNRAELRASFSGTPVPTCRWFYNENELIDGLDGYTITTSETNSSLLINSVDKKHFGEYLCTIRNQNGEELANAMILSEVLSLFVSSCTSSFVSVVIQVYIARLLHFLNEERFVGRNIFA